jgi:hypothetical protein
MEHDGSLSRNDIYFGDNHSFNQAIFDTVAAHFGHETISIKQAGVARSERIKAARAANPDFELTDDGENFSRLETALYLRLFGHGTEGHARTEWVEILFRESLPFPRLVVSSVFFSSCRLLLSSLPPLTFCTGEERLPFKEGFKRSEAVLTSDEIDELAQKVADAGT